MVKSALAGNDALTWELVKKNHSFIRKSRQAGSAKQKKVFSVNNLNVYTEHNFKSCGLLSKAVGLKGSAKSVTLYTRGNKGQTVETNVRRNNKRAVKSIKLATEDRFYRRDLAKAALIKMGKIARSRNSTKRYDQSKPSRRTQTDDDDEE